MVEGINEGVFDGVNEGVNHDTKYEYGTLEYRNQQK